LYDLTVKRLRILLVSFLLLGSFQFNSAAHASNCRTIQNLAAKLRIDLELSRPFTNKIIDDTTTYYQSAIKQPNCVSSSQYKIIVETTKDIQSDCLKFKKGSWEYKQTQVLWNNKWEYQCKSIKKIKVK
jgi:hypothetical protein